MRGTERTKGTKDLQSAGLLVSLESLSSLSDTSGDKFIPPHGGYQDLLSYQKSLVVYDATLYFCNRFFSKFDRTREQMIQAARSGKPNILEGSEASGTSKETEIKHSDPAICANAIAGLVKVTCYLLDRQIERLVRDFLKEGGLRERMTRARIDARSKQRPQ